MIVVDTNIVAYLFFESVHTSVAQRVQAQDAEWRVPVLWRHEFLNVLVTTGRARSLSHALLSKVWDQAIDLLEPLESSVDMKGVIDLGIRHAMSAYDAQFVCLAQMLGIRLITEDRKLQRLFPDRACSMESFLSKIGEK